MSDGDSDAQLALEDVDARDDEIPVTESVKLHGPPGTGKTTTSAARVAKLIKHHNYSLRDVCWATYRNALAFDTLTKLAGWGVIPESEQENWGEGATKLIATAHAVGYRLMPDLPDPVETWHKADFCDLQNLQYYSQYAWEDTQGKLLFDVFYWLKKNLYDPSDPSDVSAAPMYRELVESWPGVDVPQQWEWWCEYKAEQSIIDFHEMLERPLEERVSPNAPILVVDEYHDAYPLMAELCEMWIQSADIVIVAGDPNQVVNSFDGADPVFFEALDLPEVLLDKSYRVPHEHMPAAETMLRNAHSPPPVEPSDDAGDWYEYRSPSFYFSRHDGWDVPDPNAKCGPVWFVHEYGVDTMYLARTRHQVGGICTALDKAGIIYSAQSGMGGWGGDTAHTRRAVYNALQKLRGVDVCDVTDDVNRESLTSYDGESNTEHAAIQLSSGETAEMLNVVPSKYLAESRGDTNDIVARIKDTDEPVRLDAFAEYVTTEFWNVFTQGENSVSSLNKTGGQQNIDDGEREALTKALKRYDAPVDPDDVPTQVLTIHAAKGQEAEDVVLYDGVTRTISTAVSDSESTQENEYRTWYVALTRASTRMHIMRDGFDWMSSFLPRDLTDTIRHSLAADEQEVQG